MEVWKMNKDDLDEIYEFFSKGKHRVNKYNDIKKIITRMKKIKKKKTITKLRKKTKRKVVKNIRKNIKMNIKKRI